MQSLNMQNHNLSFIIKEWKQNIIIITVIIFCSVFIKKNNQTEFFKKKNRNRFKPTGFGSVRFFRTKTGSNRFGSVFSCLAWFFG